MNTKYHCTVADLRGAPPASAPPYGSPKFSQFHAVFRKIWQDRMLAPPRGLAPPPAGNPGSAPVTRKHSSRLRTARLPTVRVGVAATRCQYRSGWVSWGGKGPGNRYTHPLKGHGTRDNPLWTEWLTDTRENITFLFRAVNITWKVYSTRLM